ncbi:hypothetical protein TorRG33x02_245300 [Trema orientale]|uniref:Uncharacterized protein n=1 Tax=Trema orientale TaxID=63057 RepID=A0A2P5DQ80_TREOI|nr:hypothetical protein TorRG33x02_245300 [Trema orientale]
MHKPPFFSPLLPHALSLSKHPLSCSGNKVVGADFGQMHWSTVRASPRGPFDTPPQHQYHCGMAYTGSRRQHSLTSGFYFIGCTVPAIWTILLWPVFLLLAFMRFWRMLLC